MPDVSVEVLVILLLLVANGFLALSEIAVVSARRSRLLQQAERGDRGAAVAAALSQSPARFLSTVQVGITLIGVLSGAYGGATIAKELAIWLTTFPRVSAYAEEVAVGVVVVMLSYLSVIIGELVPKRIALSAPERFASRVARPMQVLSRVASPVVTALELSSNLLIRTLRLPQGADSGVTEADVAAMVAAGTAAGVFEPAERQMVERVFRLDDEPVAAMMTPRREIVWLDANAPGDAHVETFARHPYSRFPVADASLDRIRGIVDVRQVLLARHRSERIDVMALARPPLFVPDRATALDVLRQLQSSGEQMAIVIDEHGGIDGLVTLTDVLLFLAAPTAEGWPAGENAGFVQRDEHSWLVDGSMSLTDFYSAIGVIDPESEHPRSYHTVAGRLMTVLGHVPQVGDRVTVGTLTFEVVDMDGVRVDKLLVMRAPEAGAS